MATTENTDSEIKGEAKPTSNKTQCPLKVLYCGNQCPQQDAGGGEPPAAEEEEKKKQRRGGRGIIKQKKKTAPQKVTIAKIPRAKKKYVTRVCGLATFEIELKEAQRFFAQKFSCGASVTGEDEITIQGDVTDDIMDVIQEKWPEVDDDSIEDLGEVKK
ncbi:density-regulated protein isoform X2 [Scyliorhinus torazame]|uniref:density-regulated protein isoform X2 n=1 Tax=Scyliorhinus torazame TaxID=75743 RepID=UPI003B5B318F